MHQCSRNTNVVYFFHSEKLLLSGFLYKW